MYCKVLSETENFSGTTLTTVIIYSLLMMIGYHRNGYSKEMMEWMNWRSLMMVLMGILIPWQKCQMARNGSCFTGDTTYKREMKQYW